MLRSLSCLDTNLDMAGWIPLLVIFFFWKWARRSCASSMSLSLIGRGDFWSGEFASVIDCCFSRFSSFGTIKEREKERKKRRLLGLFTCSRLARQRPTGVFLMVVFVRGMLAIGRKIGGRGVLPVLPSQSSSFSILPLVVVRRGAFLGVMFPFFVLYIHYYSPPPGNY